MNSQNRKKKIILAHRSSFLARLSTLLKEGYTFHDALILLLPHHMNEYDDMHSEIDKSFRAGYGVTHILSSLGFPSGALLPVAIAEADGRLPEALSGIAIRMKKADEAQKKMKKLVAYPLMLFVFITLLLLAFRRYFLPNMAALAASRTGGDNGMIDMLPTIVSKIPDVLLGTGILIGLIGIGFYHRYRKYSPNKKIQILTKLPLVNKMFPLWKTRDFAGEVGSLLQSGLSMQDALDVLISQRLDLVLSEIAKNVKELIIYGEPFHSAVGMTTGLTKQLSSFAEHGATSGHLAKELIIYSEHLDETIDRQFAKGLAILQPALFSLIAICILAAYLALLLPVYSMIENF